MNMVMMLVMDMTGFAFGLVTTSFLYLKMDRFYFLRRKEFTINTVIAMGITLSHIGILHGILRNFRLFTTMRKQESLKTPAKCNLA